MAAAMEGDVTVATTTVDDMPPGVLLGILVMAGAWVEELGKDEAAAAAAAAAELEAADRRAFDAGEWDFGEACAREPEKPLQCYSALSVCRKWNSALMGSPAHVASLLLQHHGSEVGALLHACAMGHVSTVAQPLELPGCRADCMGGMALGFACKACRSNVVRLLLEYHRHAPRADGAAALCWVARYGQEAIVRLLLEFPRHAPRADARQGEALVIAAEGGHAAIVQLLLAAEHAPRADCQSGTRVGTQRHHRRPQGRRAAADQGAAAIAPQVVAP
ncbi:hypothetical protein FOA52_012978 [Chlamydomonas sp. UWO 241]|nr:hypothetical protein FOA52_012978 [Chlamydomonas sp. UWO 241]